MVETALRSYEYRTPTLAARSRSRSQTVVGLDVLRFAAAFLVMGFHMACTSWADPRSEAAGIVAGAARYPELLVFARNGWVGVPMFFVISGFVIAFSAENATAARFLRSRILRLAPGVWICGTVSLFIALRLEPDGVGVSLARYLKTMVLFPIPRWIDGVYWTLSIEMAFYAIVWLLLVRNRLACLERVMVAIGCFSTIVWVLAASPWFPGIENLANKRIAQLLLVTHGCEFALGVLASRVASAGCAPGRLASLLFCSIGALLQVILAGHTVLRELDLGAPDHVPAIALLSFLAVFALVIWSNAAVVRALPPRLASGIRFVGLSTYPLYLLHTFVGLAVLRLCCGIGMGRMSALVTGMLCAISAAMLTAAYAEPVVRRQLARGLDRVMPGR